jgi:GT2 family glycosyltransferase
LRAAATQVSVVCPTHERPERLARLLDSLRAQRLDPARFELVVVDDGSGPQTAATIAAAVQAGLAITCLRNESAAGPANARNRGWRAATAPLIAFIDDDCVADPGWLEAGLAAASAHPGAIVQGRVAPDPDELPGFGPFSQTLEISAATTEFETANIFYPRALLERLDGFDESFPMPVGEDTDLGWRALEQGTPLVFAGDALVLHAVLQLGPLGKLRRTRRWRWTPEIYKRHPGLRRTLLAGIFWQRRHLEFSAWLLARALPRRHVLIRQLLGATYTCRIVRRRSGPLLAPYMIVHDASEVAAIVEGAVRARFLMI